MVHIPTAVRGYLLASFGPSELLWKAHWPKGIASKVWSGSMELSTDFYLMGREGWMVKEHSMKLHDHICLYLDSYWDCMCSCVCSWTYVCTYAEAKSQPDCHSLGIIYPLCTYVCMVYMHECTHAVICGCMCECMYGYMHAYILHTLCVCVHARTQG